MQATDVWMYRDRAELGFDPTSGTDITGYAVEALDGSIGKVDLATYDTGHNYLIVDTGPWIFGRKVVLPARAVEAIDLDNRKVVVRLTKDQSKGSPELDDSTDFRSDEYRSSLGSYYDTYVRP